MEIKNFQSVLLSMAHKDQETRAIALKSGQLDQAIDMENTARMKEIIDEYGWPTPKMVGDEASQAAWILIQHADLDPVFQNKCLALMKGSYDQEPNALLKEHIDSLTIRVKNPLPWLK